MNKILYWISQNFTHYCLAKTIQDKIEADIFAIIDVTNKPKTFFQNQKIVDFNKIWFYHDFINEIDKDLFRIKVGKQLFSSKGPHVVEELIALGFDVFLDLKLHDIPNTVSKALENICNLGVWMTNIHLLGGKEMIEEATSIVKKVNNNIVLVGVTVLTSLNNNNLSELGFDLGSEELALKLAKLGKENYKSSDLIKLSSTS